MPQVLKTKIIIYLEKSAIELKLPNQTKKLDIPPVLLTSQKLLDSKGLERLIIEFINKNYPHKRYKVILSINQNLHLPAGYSETVARAVTKLDWQISSESDPVFQSQIKRVANYRLSKSQIVTFLSLACFVVAVFVAWQILGSVFQTKSQSGLTESALLKHPTVATDSAQALSLPSLTPSATPNLDLSKLTARISNASPSATTVNKLKIQLLNDGFPKVQMTTNSQNQLSTTVVYSSAVNPAIRSLVKGELNKDFNKIVVLPDDPAATIDIVIVGGID